MFRVVLSLLRSFYLTTIRNYTSQYKYTNTQRIVVSVVCVLLHYEEYKSNGSNGSSTSSYKQSNKLTLYVQYNYQGLIKLTRGVRNL